MDIIDTTLLRPGRLDQFIYIPISYYDIRLSIIRTILRTSLISRDGDLSYLAAHTNEFTGAGLTEIYQSTFYITIREEIERDMERERFKEENTDDDDTMEGNDDNVDDSMHTILSRHFESAVRNARKPVSDRDLAQYAYFAHTL